MGQCTIPQVLGPAAYLSSLLILIGLALDHPDNSHYSTAYKGTLWLLSHWTCLNYLMCIIGMLVRALYEHWSRSQIDSPISEMVKAFLSVQVSISLHTLRRWISSLNKPCETKYNAAITLSRAPGTDFYNFTWTGPPATSMIPWGQLATADILNSAVGLLAQPSPMYVYHELAPL